MVQEYRILTACRFITLLVKSIRIKDLAGSTGLARESMMSVTPGKVNILFPPSSLYSPLIFEGRLFHPVFIEMSLYDLLIRYI